MTDRTISAPKLHLQSRQEFGLSGLFAALRNGLFLTLAIFALTSPQIAQAQFSKSYNFLKAVRERDGQAATDLLNEPGTTIVNTRALRSGETGLHIVVERRDATWIAFLIQRGADPNITDSEGLTPLMLATNLRYMDGIELLLKKGADVNKSNSRGETPLIRAVQFRDLTMVRLLLKNGADPDRVDNIAGQSARDYASGDARAAAILAEIEKKDDDESTLPTEYKLFGPTL